MPIAHETWKPIEGHSGYEVSDLGRVRSLDRIVSCRRADGTDRPHRQKGRVLKPQRLPSGYMRVCLGSRFVDYVHRLVLLAFVGPCPDGMQCAHDDGCRANNFLKNLAWKTPVDNNADKHRHGTALIGDKNPAWAGSSCINGHEFTPENTRVEKRASGTVRVCRACAREHARRARGTPSERFRDGFEEKMRTALDLMKGGERAIHAARIAGVGRAALGKAWRSLGESPRTRRGPMTAPRIELAREMIEEHRHVEREILPALRLIEGPDLSRSAVYSWVRAHKRAEREAA